MLSPQQDIKIPSAINTLIIAVVLKTLDKDDRMLFYKYMNQDITKAAEFVNEKIPNIFETILIELNKIKEAKQ
jgi:hypothetical protein